MRLYIFKSQTQNDLRAFSGDVSGANLPERFRPWHAVGVVGAGRNPPHNLPKEQIEAAIEAHGFQLWRVKPKATVG